MELRIGSNGVGHYVEVLENFNYFLFYNGRYRIDSWSQNYDSLGLTECNRQVYYQDKVSAELAITEFRRQEEMDELKKVEAEIQRLEALKKKLTRIFKRGQWFKTSLGTKLTLVQVAWNKYQFIDGAGNRWSDNLIECGEFPREFSWNDINKVISGVTPINVTITEI